MQNWKKIGLLHNSNNSLEWQSTHAMMPCVLIKDDFIEVYFSPRDSKNQSRPAKLELHLIDDNFHIKNLSKTPLLELGQLGMYDDSGVMPTCIVKDGETLRMFYNGWTLGKKIPFTSFNGIAESNNQGVSFKKLSLAPKALYRNDIDPYSTFAPFVLKVKNEWHMWYVSLIKWENEENKSKHYYHIKHASSIDGLKWNRTGKVCIDFSNEYEYAIARPCIQFENNTFKMWYSFRAGKENLTYRIGYAESKNGTDWVRKDDEVNLTTSYDGWDSQMICYSYVFNFKKEKYMIYNGNNYGKTGFGIAKLHNNII